MTAGRILVTGATGFVGSNLVRILIEEDGVDPSRIRVLVRRGSPRLWMLEGLPVERIDGSLEDGVAIARGLEGCEVLHHCAAYLGVNTSRAHRFRRTNVAGTRRILGIAREKGLRRAVVYSSIAATALGSREQPATEDTPFDLGRFRMPYVDSKRAAEQAALAENRDGLEVVVVNPAFIFGPGDVKPVTGLILLSIEKGHYRFTPPGGISTVDVRDVCRGGILAAERGCPGERYILAERQVGFFELTQFVARLRGVPRPVGRLSEWTVGIAGLVGDLITHLGFDLPLNSGVARYSCAWHCTSGEKAERELGLRYRPLDETIQDSFAWFAQHGYLEFGSLQLLTRSMQAGA